MKHAKPANKYEARYRAAKCAEKTARGNVYRKFREASRVVLNIRRRKGQDGLEAFRCSVCGRWHIGKRKGGSKGSRKGGTVA